MTLTSNQRNWVVFLSAIAITTAAAVGFLGSAGSSDDNIRWTLRLSAQAAFIVLLVVFVARPMRQLFNTPLTRAILKNRRLLGIAFAGIHTAHLGLIFFRDRQSEDFNVSISGSPLGALTYVVIYLMFFTSFDSTARALGPKNWRILHKVGLYWVFAVFTQTQLPQSLDTLSEANWSLLALIIAALVVRLTAYFAKDRLAHSSS